MKRPLSLVALFLVIVAALRLWAGGRAAPPGAVSTTQLQTKEELWIAGQVYQKDETSIYLKSVCILKSNAYGHSTADSRQGSPCVENFICELKEETNLPLGRTVALKGVFYPYSSATNPGEFDSAVYYRTLEVGGKLRKAEIIGCGQDSWPVRNGLYQIKCYLKDRLYRIFPEKEAAVMSALLLGDKKELDSDLKELYKRNGILHILSISSLHITIIGMSVYKLLRKMGLPICLSAMGGSILLLLYGGMTGFGVSACRAIGMYLIRMLGEMVGRTYDMLTALGVMGAVMVVRNPYYLQNSGFLLSFSSVLGIGIVSPILGASLDNLRISDTLGKKTCGFGEALALKAMKLGKYLLQSAVASLSITLTTLPIQLWFYYEIPVYSVLLNLFVLPLMKPMMITGLLSMLVPGLGIVGAVDYFILKSYEFLCSCFDKLPFHTWNPGCPKIWQIVVYYLLLAGVLIARSHGKRVSSEATDSLGTAAAHKGGRRESIGLAKLYGIAEVCALTAGILLFTLRPAPRNRVTFLDVGQGDCILVETASGENYLFDCGSSSRSNVGKYLLLPYLKYNGIHNIDAVFLSHPDADHINGAVELFEIGGDNNIAVGQLLLPAIRKEDRKEKLGELEEAARWASQSAPLSIAYLKVGDSFCCDSASFTCLNPCEGLDPEDINACSLCFYVEFWEETSLSQRGASWTMLLTGDVQNQGENALQQELQLRDIKDITLLKAAHHGSKNSTPKELLDQLSPKLTVISSGRNNRYGHPHAELLERLEDSDTTILQTAWAGAITVSFHAEGIRVTTFCEQASR